MPADSQDILARVQKSGVAAASLMDLVAVGFSRRAEDANQADEMAKSLLRRFSAIQGLQSASAMDLRDLTGLEAFEVIRAQALMEIGRRISNAGKGEVKFVNRPQDVAALLSYLNQEKREHFVAVLLDAQGGLIRIATIHVGTLTSSIVGPREVFREAIRDGASSVIVAHNHPSGNPEPSPEDIHVTNLLVEVGKMLDISVDDHVIIGDPGFVSLRQRGVIRG